MAEPLHPAQILFTERHPLTSVLQLKFNATVNDTLTVELNAPETFSEGDGQSVHTGFSTLILDTVMGSCVLGELEQPQPIATIKLNCNHLRKAEIGEALICSARYDGEENQIAYVTGELRTAKGNHLLSVAIGTFMLGTTKKPLESQS